MAEASRWQQLAFVAIALAWASVVTFALQPGAPVPAKDPEPPRMRVQVSARTATAPAIAPVKAVERLKTAQPEKLRDRAPTKTATTKTEVPRVLSADTVVEAQATLPPQPVVASIPPVATPATAGLPMIGQEPAPQEIPQLVTQAPAEGAGTAPLPEAPPDGVSTTYPHVAPFGKAVVYALLMDSSGTVQDVRIVVPSADPLADISYSMALRGARIQLDPPLAPGELKWMETKIDYRSKNEEVLP